MADAVTSICPDHADRFECPDALMAFSDKTSVYGIIVHDGGSSFVSINFCPWCGAKLASADLGEDSIRSQ